MSINIPSRVLKDVIQTMVNYTEISVQVGTSILEQESVKP